MRKKWIIIVCILICFTTVVCCLAYEIVKRQSKNEKIKFSIVHLPNFEFYQLDSTKYSAWNINKEKSTVFIHFNTECEHCQAEAELIHVNINDFKDAQIIMVAPNPRKDILAFSKKYGINQHSQIKILSDKDYSFTELFGPSPFPSMYIYDKNQHLVKEYHGVVKIEAITKYLN